MGRDPLQDLMLLQERMKHLFEQSIETTESEGDTAHSWTPLVDIFETENEFVIEAELGQVKREDLEVELQGNTLTIGGTRRHGSVGAPRNYHQRERKSGRFLRRFTLSGSIEGEAIQAGLQDGVLTIRIPKGSPAQSRLISVE